MKNVIFLVVDCLSREYIDRYPLSYNNIFQWLDKHAISAENMYSTAPYTDSAVQSLWCSRKPMETFWGNVIEEQSPKTMFTLFQEHGYEMFITDCTSVEGYALDFHEKNIEKAVRKYKECVDRRLIKYIKHFAENGNSEWHVVKCLTNLLTVLFDEAVKILMNQDIEIERRKFISDKEAYSKALINNSEHSFWKIQWRLDVTENSNMVETYPINENEYELAKTIADINRGNLYRFNKSIKDGEKLCQAVLDGKIENRCVKSNSDIFKHGFRERSKMPDVDNVHRYIKASGIFDFIENHRKDLSKPYFAYFHEFSFHYPEVFMDAGINENNYEKSVKRVMDILPKLNIDKMSVIKALSLVYVSEGIKALIDYLEEKDVFKDTYLIITADHGISNFMYPIDRYYTWMFYKETFHVPFWIVGKDINPRKYKNLCISTCVVPTLLELLGIQNNFTTEKSLSKQNNKYIMTEWMNGVPDIFTEYVKIGYRNKNISMTYGVYLAKPFVEGKLFTLFDLQNDPDEIYNLAGQNELRIKNEVNEAMEKIEKRYDELRKKYIEKSWKRG